MKIYFEKIPNHITQSFNEDDELVMRINYGKDANFIATETIDDHDKELIERIRQEWEKKLNIYCEDIPLEEQKEFNIYNNAVKDIQKYLEDLKELENE